MAVSLTLAQDTQKVCGGHGTFTLNQHGLCSTEILFSKATQSEFSLWGDEKFPFTAAW